jgi:hypothetical protein
MSVMAPTHFNQQFASTTQLWSGSDSEENFKANCAIEENYKKLKDLGWLDGKVLTYQYNSQGFRDEEFDQQPAGIALGCSHTQGVGIHAKQTWPRQLQHMLGQKIWNLGSGGAALDTCYRLLEYWIEHLNVKFVVCAVPGITRYEVFDSNWSNILSMMPIETDMPWLAGYQKNYLLYDQNSELNQRKNLQAMQYICNKYNIPFYYDLMEDFMVGPLARDLMHSGADAQERLANKFFNIIKGNNK